MPDLRRSVFRTDPVRVGVAPGGREFLFPYLDAGQWLGLMSSDDWPGRLISRMDADPYEELLQAVEEGSIDRDSLVRLAQRVLAEAAGRPWWEAERLIGTCFTDGGRVLGMVLLAGLRPADISLAAFCCTVWAQITRGLDGADLMKQEAQLMVPPPGVIPEETEDPDDSLTAVVQRMQAMPGMRLG